MDQGSGIGSPLFAAPVADESHPPAAGRAEDTKTGLVEKCGPALPAPEIELVAAFVEKHTNPPLKPEVNKVTGLPDHSILYLSSAAIPPSPSSCFPGSKALEKTTMAAFAPISKIQSNNPS